MQKMAVKSGMFTIRNSTRNGSIRRKEGGSLLTQMKQVCHGICTLKGEVSLWC